MMRRLYDRLTPAGIRGNPVVFSEELLRGLVASGCEISLTGTHVQVKRTNDYGETELVVVRTKEYIPNDPESLRETVPARDICKEAQVDCDGPLVKAARSGAKCASCLVPRPLYACANCKERAYCGKRCQEKDWIAGHHLHC